MLAEHDRPAPERPHPTFAVRAHRSGEDELLDVAPLPHEVRSVVSVADPDHVLRDNRPVVEHRRDVMAGGANDLHPARVRLMVRLRARERRQERVVDVDDPALPLVDKLRRENLHVTGEHDEIDVMLGEQFTLFRLRLGLVVSLDRHVHKRQIESLGDRSQRLVVRDDEAELRRDELHRDCRRPQQLKDWSHDEHIEEVLARSEGTRRSAVPRVAA